MRYGERHKTRTQFSDGGERTEADVLHRPSSTGLDRETAADDNHNVGPEELGGTMGALAGVEGVDVELSETSDGGIYGLGVE